MAEWLKAPVLKTGNGATRSGVRIPPPPPQIKVPKNKYLNYRYIISSLGGMAEWLKAPVSKAGNGATRSGVQIPLPPPSFLEIPLKV